MPTQKIDPKVIFASDAPAIDKPPVFSDKTKGWDVSRANDGRPTIKEMNKVQQDTDLKILWLNENSVTPYDASIDYPEGAVAIKDGSFKQLSSGAWVEFLDDFANKDEVKRGTANRYDSSLTYNSGERVVLTNGDIVKSTLDGNANDPNVTVTGWVKTNDASQIIDASGKSQQEVNGLINKTGLIENLAESVDSTPFLQVLIDAMPNGMTLDLLGKTFRVKKNTGFASDYPKGDQPCLVIKNKKNIKITNGKLLVKEHGQGCFDVINSTVKFDFVTIQGAGNFPPLDGITGRAEKSVSGTGWFDETMYNVGDPRNNSVDTSGYSTGGFGGNFPQWGGGTASTWGVWNGGFIRNYGDGVFAFGTSDVEIANCDIFGFNGASVAIAEGKLTAFNNKFHDNYSYGVFGKAYAEGLNKTIESITVFNNDIYNIGHPDSQPSDLLVDPGYGIATSNKSPNIAAGVQRYTVTSNNFKNCKRKAIDAHHSYYADISGNKIDSCGYGVWVTIGATSSPPKATIIRGNYIKNIQQSLQASRVCGIEVSFLATHPAQGTAFTGLVNISDNILEDVGVLKTVYDANTALYTSSGHGILVIGIEEAVIKGNSFINSNLFMCDGGIVDGLNTAGRCARSIISDNYIRAGLQYGILAFKDSTNQSNAKYKNASIVANNILDVVPRHGVASVVGIWASSLTKVIGNEVLTGTGIIPYAGVNPKGSTIAFNHNPVSGSVSSFSTPETFTLASNLFTISSDTYERTINFPAGFKIGSLSIDERYQVGTANYLGLVVETLNTTDTAIKIKYFKVDNGVRTAVPLADITIGILRITVNLV